MLAKFVKSMLWSVLLTVVICGLIGLVVLLTDREDFYRLVPNGAGSIRDLTQSPYWDAANRYCDTSPEVAELGAGRYECVSLYISVRENS